nr:MAG TPA: hypothetical protein [Caudoviricetes sp.]
MTKIHAVTSFLGLHICSRRCYSCAVFNTVYKLLYKIYILQKTF